MKKPVIVPHERFETIEEVFAYVKQTMDSFRDSGVVEKTPEEAINTVFTLNEAFCELSKVFCIHLKRAKFYIDMRENS